MKKIIFLGDSITDAGHLWEHPPLGLGYVRLLSGPLSSRCPDIRILNKGQDGFTAARVLQTLAENCLNYSPDAASLLIGINDVAAAQNTGRGLSRIHQRDSENTETRRDSTDLLRGPFSVSKSGGVPELVPNGTGGRRHFPD